MESDSEIVYALRGESRPRSLFDREVAAVERMIRGRRKSAGFIHDEWSDIHFLGQRVEATNGAVERADEDNRNDEEAEAGERAKPASSMPGKKSGRKRSSTKEDAGAEDVGIVEDGIPF